MELDSNDNKAKSGPKRNNWSINTNNKGMTMVFWYKSLKPYLTQNNLNVLSKTYITHEDNDTISWNA